MIQKQFSGLHIGAYILLAWYLILPSCGQDPLQSRQFDRGNRFEGATPAAAGDFVLEVVSLTAYVEPFGLNSILKVSFFLPSGETQAQVHAQELNVRTGYFMNSKQTMPSHWRSGAWNEFSPWPTRDVIDIKGISQTNLGVLVELAPKDGLRRFTPGFVCSNQCAATATTYRMMLRPGARVTKIEFRISSANREVLTGAIPVADTLDRSPVPFVIDAAQLPVGDLRVRLVAKIKNHADLEPPIDFFVSVGSH